MAKQLPLVIVLGATACGKSRLAIDLAKRFSGEIISADSMQVYRGLDIVTNKVSEEEQLQAKHHMINIVSPLQVYSVTDFRDQALRIIDDLMDKGRLPIVVGGTNYYIESLMWKNFLLTSVNHERESHTLLDSEKQSIANIPKHLLHSEEDFSSLDKFFSKPIYGFSFQNVDNEKLWTILEQVDETSAHLYHPNDKRRVRRSLQLIQRKKKRYSDLLSDVNKSIDGIKPSLGGPLRYKSMCVLWLSCDKNTLDRVTDERVDQMLDRGLLAELETFYDEHGKNESKEIDRGIFQTIGFKEFREYVQLDKEARESEKGQAILRKSIDQMKRATRKYAGKQIHWIETRILQAGTRDLPPLYKLSTTFDEQSWNDLVRDRAFEIVESFLEGTPMSDRALSLRVEPQDLTIKREPGKFYCQDCDRLLIGSFHIESHLKSGRHKRRSMSKKKKELLQLDHSEATCNSEVVCVNSTPT